MISYSKPRQFVLFSSFYLIYSAHSSLQCPEFYTDKLIFWFKMTGHMLSNVVKIILLPAIITRELEYVMSKSLKGKQRDPTTELTIRNPDCTLQIGAEVYQ